MKILITGGCGFLGSNLAASYLGEGAEVVILDALLRIGGESNLAWLQEAASRAGRLTFHRGDVPKSSRTSSGSTRRSTTSATSRARSR